MDYKTGLQFTRDLEPGEISPFELTYESAQTKRIDAIFTQSTWPWIDTAWALMLMKKGVTNPDHVSQLAEVIVDFWSHDKPPIDEFASVEKYAIQKLGVEIGGTLGHGRTIPPYKQMIHVRHELMKLMCLLLDLHESTLDTAERYKSTVMPGYTHIRHAQPETFGHYLLSAYDPMARIMEQVEQAYHLMSLSELGCGALSGTSLPIDRDMVAEYLGLEGVIENANDAVAYTDGYVSLVCSLGNMISIWSRVSMDLNYWSSEEFRFLSFPWFFQHPPQSKGGKGNGHSYFMPNKIDNSPYLERTRVSAAVVQGCAAEVLAQASRCPHADMVEMMCYADASQNSEPTLRSIRSLYHVLHLWVHGLPRMKVNEKRMYDCVRRGWSCASELTNHMVLNHGLSGRVAHQIVNNLVCDARERDIPADQVTKAMLDKAAEGVIDHELAMTEEELRLSLDPVNFIEVTTSRGGTSPGECQRMIDERRKSLAKARERHAKRIDDVEQSKVKMMADLKALVKQPQPVEVGK